MGFIQSNRQSMPSVMGHESKNRIDEVHKIPCENETKSTELIYN